MLLLLDDGSEDLGTLGVLPKVFLNIFPKIKLDGHDHSISVPSKIVVVEVADTEKNSISFPNPRSCKGLNPLAYFLIFVCYPLI